MYIIYEPSVYVLYAPIFCFSCNTFAIDIKVSASPIWLLFKVRSIASRRAGETDNVDKKAMELKDRNLPNPCDPQNLVSKYSQVAYLAYSSRGASIVQQRSEWIGIVIEGIFSIGKYCYRIIYTAGLY